MVEIRGEVVGANAVVVRVRDPRRSMLAKDSRAERRGVRLGGTRVPPVIPFSASPSRNHFSVSGHERGREAVGALVVRDDEEDVAERLAHARARRDVVRRDVDVVDVQLERIGHLTDGDDAEAQVPDGAPEAVRGAGVDDLVAVQEHALVERPRVRRSVAETLVHDDPVPATLAQAEALPDLVRVAAHEPRLVIGRGDPDPARCAGDVLPAHQLQVRLQGGARAGERAGRHVEGGAVVALVAVRGVDTYRAARMRRPARHSRPGLGAQIRCDVGARELVGGSGGGLDGVVPISGIVVQDRAASRCGKGCDQRRRQCDGRCQASFATALSAGR